MWEMKQYLLLFNAAQNVQHVIPYHLDGRNQKSLVWSVDIAKSRTEAYHVEVWVTLREETALQTGMDALYQWLLAEELFVTLHGDVGC